MATGATANSGAAAPAGTQWSEAPNPFGNTQQANTSAGVSCSVTTTVTFRCADDFNVPPGQTWTVNQVVVFAYQTGFAGGTSPILSGTLRIWNGRPGDVGATIIFGDTTTNRLGTSVDSSLWRIFNTVVGAGANPPTAAATNRRVWQTSLNVSPSLVLPAGNYWIDWNTTIAASAAHFAPSVSYKGIRGVYDWNSRQFSSTTSLWTTIVDAGQFPTGAPTPSPFPQDFPFKLIGSIAGAPAVPTTRSLDFNGDNKTDFSIVRSASVAGQTSWWTQDSAGGQSTVDFGLGAGFAGGDRVVAADYDGDGKTDIAVWRAGPPTVASFYIINSTNGTIRVESFGQTGDDPSIVGDYDGDGKADLAVYRPGASAGLQSTFFYRGSLSNPSGNVTYVGFGLNGDVPLGGDFDGDGRFDFHVMRNEAGQMVHYEARTTAGFRVYPYGLPTDRFFVGDFDIDRRMDVGAVRATAPQYDWFLLRSTDGVMVWDRFGTVATDLLTPGDYDGDGQTDLAVWRTGPVAETGSFFVRNTFSSPGQVKWGASTVPLTAPDYPVANFTVK